MGKLDYLINYLLEENNKVRIKEILIDKKSKQKLYRSLCNIREPKPIDDKYKKIENEYLQEELQNKELTKIENVKTLLDIFPDSNQYLKDKICLWKGDITTLEIEAIVNAANSEGIGCFIPCHKCIDNAIHSASGIQLRLECNKKMKKIGKLKTGKAFITKSYNLPSKYIIHTVGPIIYEKVSEENVEQLKNCYLNSLKLAKEKHIREIVFPCISTGEFRFPKDRACKIAIETVKKYLVENAESFDKVIFNVFTDEDYNIYLKILGDEYGRI